MQRKDLLERTYYEYDNAFYKNKMNISCWNEMQYQSLRDYSADFFAVFCEDVNAVLAELGNEIWYISANEFEYKNKIFNYICVTEAADSAEQAIISILEKKKIVVFQTATDALHTSIWFHEKEPFRRYSHNAIIIGYDSESFFYVDSPPMRNPKYFIPHNQNPTVGRIPKEELLRTFDYHCQIGYIDVNESEINKLPSLYTLLENMYINYNTVCEDYFLGRNALEKLANLLSGTSEVKGIFDDVFSFDLIKSRNRILIVNIRKRGMWIEDYLRERIINVLSELYVKWGIVEGLALKYTIVKEIAIQNKIASIIKNEVIPLTDQLMILIRSIL